MITYMHVHAETYIHTLMHEDSQDTERRIQTQRETHKYTDKHTDMLSRKPSKSDPLGPLIEKCHSNTLSWRIKKSEKGVRVILKKGTDIEENLSMCMLYRK